MNALRLSRLEDLANRRAERAQRRVQCIAMELDRLARQHADLRRFNRGYQRTTDTQALPLPALMQCRRDFVGALQVQIDQLAERICTLRRELKQLEEQLRRLAAEAQALGAMADRTRKAIAAREQRNEQRQNDDVGLAMRFGRARSETSEYG